MPRGCTQSSLARSFTKLKATAPMKLSVIIPVYNDWHRVPNLLSHLALQSCSAAEFEVILVDNGSRSILSVIDSPLPVDVLYCEKPGSYAARNVGIQHAKGEILAFTDADCLPSPSWLDSASKWFEQGNNANTIVAGGVSLFLTDPEKPSVFALYDYALGIPQERYVRRGYGVTANLFVPRHLFNRVGLFDSKRLSGGDAEFCRRATSSGNARIVYLPSAQIRHPSRSSWHELSGKARRVKGGQLLSGSVSKRVQFGIRTLLPPLNAWTRAFKSNRLSFTQKLLVCLVQLRLWGVEIAELWQLAVMRNPPQR